MNYGKAFVTTKIKQVQIDTCGRCLSKCWCCPVRYYPRPSNQVMSMDLFDSILRQIKELQKDGLAEESVTIWIAAFSDPLADPLFPQRMESLRRFGFRIPLVTNGIGILANVEVINEYKDVIGNISVNLPAGNELDYARHTLNEKVMFHLIVSGLEMLHRLDSKRFTESISVVVNGAYNDDIARDQLLYNLPEMDTEKQCKQLQALFPYYRVDSARPLCDRAGLLIDKAIDNTKVRYMWRLPSNVEEATVCNGGNRLTEWFHITNRGHLITCCQDFLEITKYGDALNLREYLTNEDRLEATEFTLKSLCTRCWFSA